MTSPPAALKFRHNALFFDIARALASQAVLLGHTLNVGWPATFMIAEPDGLLEAKPGLFYIQDIGVLVFFVISGYLITSSALRMKRYSYAIRAFLIRRFARIFTPLIPFLILVFLVEREIYGDGENIKYMTAHLDLTTLILNSAMLFDNPLIHGVLKILHVGNIWTGTLGTAAQLWTVVIEWWVYICFGLVFFTVVQRRSAFSLCWLVVAAAVPGYALVTGSGLIVAWVIGMAARLLAPEHGSDISAPPRSRGYWLLAAMACGILAAARLMISKMQFYDVAFALLFASALMFLHAFAAPDGRSHQLGARVVRGASNISYSLYLVHLPVVIALATFLPIPKNSWAILIAMVIAANIAAILFYLLFERHYPAVTRWLGDRFIPGQRWGKSNA